MAFPAEGYISYCHSLGVKKIKLVLVSCRCARFMVVGRAEEGVAGWGLAGWPGDTGLSLAGRPPDVRYGLPVIGGTTSCPDQLQHA